MEPNLSAAINNAFDGTALLETAEDALAKMLALLHGIREAARRASNEALSPADRAVWERDVQQRLAEMKHIASTSRFKGKKILQGGLGCAYFQIGTNTGKILCINLTSSVRPSAIGAIATATTAVLTPVSGSTRMKGSYTTPPISDLNYFTATKHANLVIDGISVGLYRDWNGDPEGAAATLQHRLNAARSPGGYTVAYANNRFTITTTTGTAPQITAASVRGVEFLGGTTVSAGTQAPLHFAPGDFALQIGTDPPVAVTGHFHSPDELAAAIEAQVTGAHAWINSGGELELAAQETITVSGAKALDPGVLGFAGLPHEPRGNLTAVSLLDGDACRQAQRRIDSAIKTITSLQEYFTETKTRFHDAAIFLRTAPETRYQARLRIADANAASKLALRVRAALQQGNVPALYVQANAAPATARMLLQQEQRSPDLAFCLVQCPRGEKGCV